MANDFGENEENQELSRVAAAREKLEDWKRENPAVSNLGQVELSLLKQMLAAPEEYRRQQFFLMCEFVNREDAYDHVAAYYEAADLGMDTSFNVAYMFACAASNEKGNKSNRVAQLLDSLSHFRYTSNTPRDDKKHGGYEKGPING